MVPWAAVNIIQYSVQNNIFLLLFFFFMSVTSSLSLSRKPLLFQKLDNSYSGCVLRSCIFRV